VRDVRSATGARDVRSVAGGDVRGVAGGSPSGLLFFAASLPTPAPVNIQLCIYEYPVHVFFVFLSLLSPRLYLIQT
jgi:hypothetical protein